MPSTTALAVRAKRTSARASFEPSIVRANRCSGAAVRAGAVGAGASRSSAGVPMEAAAQGCPPARAGHASKAAAVTSPKTSGGKKSRPGSPRGQARTGGVAPVAGRSSSSNAQTATPRRAPARADEPGRRPRVAPYPAPSSAAYGKRSVRPRRGAPGTRAESRAATRAGTYTGSRPSSARSKASLTASATAPAMPARAPRTMSARSARTARRLAWAPKPGSVRERDALVSMRALLEDVEQADGVVFRRNAALTALVHEQVVVADAVAPRALTGLDECRRAHVRPADLLDLAPELQRFAMRERDGFPCLGEVGGGEQLDAGFHGEAAGAAHDEHPMHVRAHARGGDRTRRIHEHRRRLSRCRPDRADHRVVPFQHAQQLVALRRVGLRWPEPLRGFDAGWMAGDARDGVTPLERFPDD